MMKKLIYLLSLFFFTAGYSQDTIRHHFSLTYSNNGQIADAVNEFYFKPKAYNDIRQSIFKINAAYSFQTKKGIEYGLQLGYGQRKDDYPRVDSEDQAAQQKYYSAIPYVLKTWEFNRFNVSTGGGIPLNKISEYHFVGKDYEDEPYHTTLDGGFSVGLNSITQLRFFLTERLSLNTSVQFGWMYSKFGGQFLQKPDNADYTPVWSMEANQMMSKKSAFTQPEFFFGLGFRL